MNETVTVKSLLEFNPFTDPAVNVLAYDSLGWNDEGWIVLRVYREIQN
jgi:hypothetical protein